MFFCGSYLAYVLVSFEFPLGPLSLVHLTREEVTHVPRPAITGDFQICPGHPCLSSPNGLLTQVSPRHPTQCTLNVTYHPPHPPHRLSASCSLSWWLTTHQNVQVITSGLFLDSFLSLPSKSCQFHFLTVSTYCHHCPPPLLFTSSATPDCPCIG